jgi:hypothetical protein
MRRGKILFFISKVTNLYPHEHKHLPSQEKIFPEFHENNFHDHPLHLVK